MKLGQIKIIAAIIGSIALSGCSSKIAFNKTFKSCEAPASSARWGANAGPLIVTPSANDPFNRNVTVTGTCVDGYPVTVAGNGIDTPVTGTCSNGTFSVNAIMNSGEGSKEIDVQQATAQDGSDSVDRLCVLQDTIPPQVTITPATGSQSVNTTTIRIEGSCESGLDVVISGPNLANTVVAPCRNAGYTATITFTGPDGLKDIVARQEDRAGNRGQDDEQYTTDTTAPVVVITAPAAMTATRSNLTLTGTCETGTRVVINGGINSVVMADCTSGSFSAPLTLSNGDGIKNIVASQTDIAGNIGSSNRNFVRDSTSPAIRITSPNSNSVSQGPITLTGTCETGLTVNLFGDISAPSMVMCSSGTFSANLALSSPDGLKNVVASQADGVGNIGTDNRNLVRDTTGPTITITNPSANSYVAPTATISGTCETGLTVTLGGTGIVSNVSTNCVASTFSSSVTFTAGDGNKQVSASQTDFVGNTASVSRTFRRDGTAPVLAITTPAANSYVGATTTISGTCESGLTVTISGTGITAPVNAACATGTFSAAISITSGDGIKNVVASQTDGAGNSTSDSRSFLRDGTAPIVAILSPSANSFVAPTAAISGTCETGLNVVINGSGTAAPVTVLCVAGLFNASVTFTSGDGTKQVTATQNDLAGNTGSDNRSFLRDSTAPAVLITSPAANSYVAPTFTVSGTCETGLTVNISGPGITAPLTTNCTTGTFSALVTATVGDGNKQVIATQVDGGGSTGSDSRIFRRDTTAPAIAITSPLANSFVAPTATVSGTCETGLNVTLNGSGLAASVTTNCTSGTFSSLVTFSTGDGLKQVIASQIDAAGNSGNDSRSFVRDSIGPAVAITAPAANSYVDNAATISGTCETGLAVILSGTGLSSSVSTACSSGNFSALVSFTAGDGNKQVTASQTDISGNTGSDSRSFRRDTTAPIIAITNPAVNTFVGTTATISGICETGLTVNLTGTGISSPTNTTCAAGNFSALVSISSGDGIKNIIATQADGAGNSASDSRNFVRDSVAPAIAITSPATNSYVGATATINGTCETGLAVTLNGAGMTGSVNATCVAGAFSALVTISVGDGSKQIIATQTDGAGNSASDSRSFIRDTAGPAIAITSPAANSYVSPTATISGTCETGLIVTLGGTGVMSPVSTSCAAGTFSASVSFTIGDGTKQVTAAQTDLSGNTGSNSRNFVRDSVAPAIAIISPAANAFVPATATISGTCETGLTVIISGLGIVAPVNVNCIAGNFSGPVAFTPGDGFKDVSATQTDLAGNVGSDSHSFRRDSVAPLVAITTPAANSYVGATATISGTCETGLTVTLNGAGVLNPVTAACVAGAFSTSVTMTPGDGVKVATASQTDLSGNTGSNSRSFVRDETGPAIAITAPAANSYVAPTATISGTCETGLTVTLNGSGVSGSASTSCTAGTFSSSVTFTAGDGSKQVTASQTDGAGNSNSNSRTFVRDSTGPAIAITSPAANSFVGPTATINGTCETGFAVTLSGTGIVSSVSTACAGGVFSGLVTFTAGDGSKQVTASQTDGAGNTGNDSRSFLRDTIGPVIGFTTPTANAFVPVSVIVTGTCETNLTVTLSGTGISGPATGGCVGGVFAITVTFTAGDGSKQVTASQTDGAGNSSSASRSFIRDTISPVIAITAPAANSYVASTALISGTCETGFNVTLDGPGVQGSINTTCAAGTFSASVTFTAGDGPKQANASQTDGAGNTGSDSRSFVRDTTSPAIAITSPAANSAVNLAATISGTCEGTYTVTLAGSGVASSVNTACAANVFSANVTFTSGTGVKTVTASQTDGAGNTGSNSRNFNKTNNSGYEVFTSRGPGGRVDILFVDDNSASMDPEQAALGNRFSSFTSALSTVDWQVGIVTTDCTSGSPYNFCGQMFDLTGRPAGEYILNSSTPDYLNVFRNTIQRPETINCIISGTCPSGREEGLKSTIEAMNRRDTDNAGFFRNDSDFAIVMLTDEDEYSSPIPAATTPAQVINTFRSIWGNTKKISNYSIIIRPGDTACYNAQRAQFGNNANYGTYPDLLSQLTGGISVSICEPDYSLTLAEIGDNVTRLSRSIDLAQTPIAGTVSVVFTPAYSTTWTVTGNRITFDVPAPAGTQVEIYYEY